MIAAQVDVQCQADLVDMQHFSRNNDGVKYILTVTDILSKPTWAIGLKHKTSSEIAGALKIIFSRGRKPQTLYID